MINIASADYIRQRLEPRPGDPLYLHLADLLLAIRDLIPRGEVVYSISAAADHLIVRCLERSLIIAQIWPAAAPLSTLNMVPIHCFPRLLNITIVFYRHKSWNTSTLPWHTW